MIDHTGIGTADPARSGSWIRTYTGRRFWPLDPRPEEVDIRDIAHALALQCRFAGHCSDFYCPTLDQRILTSDLEWVPAAELTVGRGLLGFDDELWQVGSTGKRRRRFRPSVVTHAQPYRRAVARLVMDDGREVRCSVEHPWLIATKGSGNQRWVTTGQIIQDVEFGRTRYLHRFLDVWGRDESWNAGWLAGIIDGEGYLSVDGRTGVQMGISQRPGLILEKIIAALSGIGFSALRQQRTGDRNCVTLQLLGGWREIARLLGTVRPVRMIDGFQRALSEGRFGKQMNGCDEPSRIVKAIPDGEDWVMGLSTSTQTYLCEGYAAHNSVAEHSVFVSGLVENAGRVFVRDLLRALLHDASEAYLCDIPRPLKCDPSFAHYRRMEWNVQTAVLIRYGLSQASLPVETFWTPEAIKHADNVALRTEARDLMGDPQDWQWPENVTPWPTPIQPWDWRTAELRFLERFEELTGERIGG